MFAITKEVRFQLRILTAGSSVPDCDTPPPSSGTCHPPPSVPTCWLCKAPQAVLPAPTWTLECAHWWCCSSLGERKTYGLALDVGLGPLGGKF